MTKRIFFLKILSDWWKIFVRGWLNPNWDGDNLYEKLLYYLITIPFIFAILIIAIYIISFLREVLHL